MLNKIFKKDEPATPEAAAKTAKSAKPAAAPPDKSPWQAKLAAADGDDAALLALAKEAPFVDIKLAAVQGLKGEAALKEAEREFRNHDRRVYREAKIKLEAAILTRETHAGAEAVIAAAEALLGEAQFPANRLVETDRAWQALPVAHVTPAQLERYQSAWNRLTALARERGDAQQGAKRWMADAEPALIAFRSAAAQAAEGARSADELAAAESALAAVADAAPAGVDAVAATLASLRASLALASPLAARIALLEELAPLKAADAADAAARWAALPAVEDGAMAAALDRRFARWQEGKQDEAAAEAEAAKKAAKEQSQAERRAKVEALSQKVEKAEKHLAAGQLAETIAELRAIEKLPAVGDKKIEERVQAVQGEVARLRGWQHWGGGRVREELVQEAEALVKAASLEKLAVKAHADAIEKLRERWKELDKLAAATSKALWVRFDLALKTAHLPVDAHIAKLKEARSQNLEARNALVTELNAVPVEAPEGASPDYRALARALEHFQAEWRKLGPIEHTVPHKSRNALEARQKAAIARLEAPLAEARRVEALKRGKLIERAKEIAADTKSRDTINKVRELQAEWQQAAKGLPLARQEENRLWAEFKAATDLVFKQRDEAVAARDAGFKAGQAEREAIIARLSALSADTPPGDIRKALAQAETDWRRAGEALRKDQPRLDQAFRRAKDNAQAWLTGSATRAWQRTVDALTARIALATEAEQGHADAERWAAAEPVPAAWDKPLAARWQRATSGAVAEADRAAASSLLLKLESALDLPSPEGDAAARREMKLLALKNALQSRQSATVSRADIEGWVGELAGMARLDAGPAGRFAKVLEALRTKPLR